MTFESAGRRYIFRQFNEYDLLEHMPSITSDNQRGYVVGDPSQHGQGPLGVVNG